MYISCTNILQRIILKQKAKRNVYCNITKKFSKESVSRNRLNHSYSSSPHLDLGYFGI